MCLCIEQGRYDWEMNNAELQLLLDGTATVLKEDQTGTHPPSSPADTQQLLYIENHCLLVTNVPRIYKEISKWKKYDC